MLVHIILLTKFVVKLGWPHGYLCDLTWYSMADRVKGEQRQQPALPGSSAASCRCGSSFTHIAAGSSSQVIGAYQEYGHLRLML